MDRFNISMRKYLKEVGVTSQQAIEQVVREENLAGKGTLKVKMALSDKPEWACEGCWSEAFKPPTDATRPGRQNGSV